MTTIIVNKKAKSVSICDSWRHPLSVNCFCCRDIASVRVERQLIKTTIVTRFQENRSESESRIVWLIGNRFLGSSANQLIIGYNRSSEHHYWRRTHTRETKTKYSVKWIKTPDNYHWQNLLKEQKVIHRLYDFCSVIPIPKVDNDKVLIFYTYFFIRD